MSNGTVKGNTASNGGGGIRVVGSSMPFSGCTVSDNFSQWGGGISVTNSTINLKSGTIQNNTSYWCGGIYLSASSNDEYSQPTVLNMTGGTVSSNTANQTVEESILGHLQNLHKLEVVYLETHQIML